MFQIEISAALRSASGKGPMRQLRMQGKTPAVVYGGGAEAIKLQLETKALVAQLLEFYRKNTVVTLKIDGVADKNVVIGEVQTDPVRDSLVHVDFCEIDLQKDRTFTVPVIFTGTAKGVDLGGDMVIGKEKVVLCGKPLDIPNECVVDVTKLAIGDNITCGQIAIPDNVRMVTSSDLLAVSIVKPGQKTAAAA